MSVYVRNGTFLFVKGESIKNNIDKFGKRAFYISDIRNIILDINFDYKVDGEDGHVMRDTELYIDNKNNDVFCFEGDFKRTIDVLFKGFLGEYL